MYLDDQRATAEKSRKLHAALHWAKGRLRRVDHERRVLLIATKLFDLTARLHQLKPRHRRLLRLAAVLHDVGRRSSTKDHAALGARLIEADRGLPLDVTERRAVCYLTRHHRGPVPGNGCDEVLRPGDGRKALRKLLGLLRAADTLDNRNLEAPAISMALKGRKLSITCYVDEESAKARKAFDRRKKFRLLEETLDCKVELYVRVAHAVESV